MQFASYKKMLNSTRRAFALIELSIVILIIGIIIAGISESDLLIAKFKLNSAKNLTANAPVIAIDNLELWLETTSENSFDEKNIENETQIASWNDLNLQRPHKVSIIQNSFFRQPLYIKRCINDLPCLRFDGENDILNYDLNFGKNFSSNYTIYIVAQNNSNQPFYQNKLLSTSFKSNLLLTSSYDFNVGNIDSNFNILAKPIVNSVSNYSDLPRMPEQIDTPQTQDQMVAPESCNSAPCGKQKIYSFIYKNNLLSEARCIDATCAYKPHLESILTDINNNEEAILFLKQNIGEVIIYSRALLQEERTAIEKYLKKKWRIN